MTDKNELFGSPEQIALMQRGQDLWALVSDSRQFSYYGRMVSLCSPGEDALEKLTGLAGLQGAASCQYYPAADADAFCEAIRARGFNPARYEQCRGGEAAFAAAKSLLTKNSLPSDLRITRVDEATPAKLVADLAELSIACGVMPVPGAAMRGQVRDGICLIALDAAETVVATASSYLCNHSESARAKDAFWRMLATSEARRSEGIGKILGAETIVRMGETFGARSFNTGITADNASSMALCATLGVVPSEWTFVGCMDPAAFGKALMTR